MVGMVGNSRVEELLVGSENRQNWNQTNKMTQPTIFLFNFEKPISPPRHYLFHQHNPCSAMFRFRKNYVYNSVYVFFLLACCECEFIDNVYGGSRYGELAGGW